MEDQSIMFHGTRCIQQLRKLIKSQSGDASPLDHITWKCSSCGRDRYGLWFEKILGGEAVRFRWAPPATFSMGLDAEIEPTSLPESPSHTVVLSRGFWVQDTPCTQGVWAAVMGGNPSHFRASDRPVECVSWKLVQAFLQKLKVMYPGFPCRLPTEAEWEYVCKQSDGDIERSAWIYENSDIGFDLAGSEYAAPGPLQTKRRYGGRGTHRVRTKPANLLGLYELLGNVLEWCNDAPRIYSHEAALNPEGIDDHERALRGGDWGTSANETRPTRRFSLPVGYCAANVGFRMVVGPWNMVS
ncbi:MAG: formylglycine-generating enzyme family protein [Rhodospirillales bacterium]|nr:formylglycine-generating enzyme family protein [Rhodospirillales bacterium]